MTERLPRLMLVTDRRRTRGRPLAGLVAEAVRGGVGAVQVREPDLDDAACGRLLGELRDAVPGPVRWVVNGRPELAREAGAGLHLPAVATLPPGAVPRPFGRSAHDAGEAERAFREGVDYVILGTLYPTASKPGHRGHGPEHVAAIAPLVEHVPLFAIGGITVSRVPEVIHAGAWGVAVCSAILESNHPRRIAEALSLALHVASGAE